MSTATLYARFAETEARGHSPCYEQWSLGIAADPEIRALIETLPPSRRQPNLILAATRLHGAEIADYPTFRAWFRAHWPEIRHTALTRTTQTNEAGRCATLLPILAALPQPLALIEVGASAGLCLYPDRYAYQYDTRPILNPTGTPLLPCATTGPVPVPATLPSIAWRAGIDLNPLDVRNPDFTAWLEALVWPEQHARRARLRAAIATARSDPPLLIQGDLNATLPALVAQAPAGTTVVVFHSAVLAYLPPPARQAFQTLVTSLPCHWIANEAPGVFPAITAPPTPGPAVRFILSLDGRAVAHTGPHGQSLDWLG